MSLTRRRVLAFGAGGAALLAAGAALRALTRDYPLPTGVSPPLALSVKELVVVRAIVQALHPGDTEFPSGLALEVDRRIDEELYSQPPEVARDLKDAVQLLEHAPVLVGRAARLTELDEKERAEVLDALRRCGPAVVVQASVALHQLASLFYFGHPGAWASIGYDGPMQPTPRPPASSERYARALAARVQGAT